jgi:transcriptional regulatory protein LEU3
MLYQSLFDPDNAIPTLQSTILVCMWPFPLDSTFKDPSNAIAGAAMNLAVQKGLPYASRKQDYARVALVQSETERAFRASLWAYCVVTFQGSVKIFPPTRNS